MAGAYRHFVTASELGGCFATPLEVKALLKADQA
jgi:hypothetical protein